MEIKADKNKNGRFVIKRVRIVGGRQLFAEKVRVTIPQESAIFPTQSIQILF